MGGMAGSLSAGCWKERDGTDDIFLPPQSKVFSRERSPECRWLGAGIGHKWVESSAETLPLEFFKQWFKFYGIVIRNLLLRA